MNKIKDEQNLPDHFRLRPSPQCGYRLSTACARAILPHNDLLHECFHFVLCVCVCVGGGGGGGGGGGAA